MHNTTAREAGARPRLGAASALQPVRAEDGSYTVQYERPADDTDWLFENLGSLALPGEDTRTPRVVDLRVDATGLTALKIVAIELVVVDGVSATFGDEVTVTAAGRLIGACLADGGGGRVLQDPEFALNDACEHWLEGF